MRTMTLEQHIAARKAKARAKKVLARDAAKLGWHGHGVSLGERYDKVRDFTLRVFEANFTHKKNGELVDVMAPCKHTGKSQEDKARESSLHYSKREQYKEERALPNYADINQRKEDFEANRAEEIRLKALGRIAKLSWSKQKELIKELDERIKEREVLNAIDHNNLLRLNALNAEALKEQAEEIAEQRRQGKPL